MQVGGVERVKTLDDSHDRKLDDAPTLLEEDPCEAIRTGRLITRHLLYGRPNLIFRDGVTQVMQVMGLYPKLLPVEVFVATTSPTHNLGEVVMDDLLFFLVLSHPPMCVFDPVNVVLPSSGIDAVMEEFCVCIPMPQVGQPSTLALPSPLKYRQTNHHPLEPRAYVTFLWREDPRLLWTSTFLH